MEENWDNYNRTTIRKENIFHKENEDSISSPWNNFKHSKIHIIGVPEEDKEEEIGNVFEKIMKGNFPIW